MCKGAFMANPEHRQDTVEGRGPVNIPQLMIKDSRHHNYLLMIKVRNRIKYAAHNYTCLSNAPCVVSFSSDLCI